MMQATAVIDIAHVIQQAVAPVFLFSGVAAILSRLLVLLQEIFVATASVRIDPPQDRITDMLREAS